MRLSVLLIGYNSWHFLEKNLHSLLFLKDRPDVEILYVDNASGDDSVSKIKALYPFVKVYANPGNLGVSKARNQALKKASGDYFWILDSDTEVNEAALDEMVTFMDSHTCAGICGCKMYGQDGTVQDSCRPFPSLKEKFMSGMRIVWNKLGGRRRDCPPISYDKTGNTPFEVDYVIGACQLIRREAQQRTGWLDEHIFYGPEDADFCLRMKQAGYKTYYLPQVSIYHAYQRISSHQVFSSTALQHIKGLIYYFWKHRKVCFYGKEHFASSL
ncbi:MAG: glycosyltransferase family 2 protein [Tannerella sp.]|jgi:GT2 family glycosyltransferase|nr:glycosyltransferase family 2 protein [Tannerella sp.]